MVCQFATLEGAQALSLAACNMPAPIKYEMVSLGRPCFASLIKSTFGGARHAGMPLFTLAR